MKYNIKLLIESLFDKDFSNLYNNDELSIISPLLKYKISECSSVDEINYVIYKLLDIENILKNELSKFKKLFLENSFECELIYISKKFNIIFSIWNEKRYFNGCQYRQLSIRLNTNVVIKV